MRKDDRRELKLFPLKAWGPVAACCLKMMAKAGAIKNGHALWVEWEMVCDSASINLKVNARGNYRSGVESAEVSLPAEKSASCW
jgi:alpha-glucosidase